MGPLRRLLGFSRALRRCIKPSPPLKWALLTVYWLPIPIVFNQYLYTLKIVTGSSMQPTLNPQSSLWRDVVIFDRFSIHFLRRYLRDDIVTLKDPVTHELIVKRITALEGDIVKTLPPYPHRQVQVPEGHAWVEGDDPFRTQDSNSFGPVPLALINARLIFIIWPLTRFGPLTHSIGSSAAAREKWSKERVKINQSD